PGIADGAILGRPADHRGAREHRDVRGLHRALRDDVRAPEQVLTGPDLGDAADTSGGQGGGRGASTDLDDRKTDRAEVRRGRDEGLAFPAPPGPATPSSVRYSAKPPEAVDPDDPQTRHVRATRRR